jgi:hypothetical protein
MMPHFVQSQSTINTGYIMVVIKVKMAASRHFTLQEFHNDKTTEDKHFKLCTGKPYQNSAVAEYSSDEV